jgi:sugar lactone lactonase YvrE
MRLLRLAIVTAMSGVLACSSSTGPGGQTPDHITVAPDPVSLSTGQTQQLTATVYDSKDSVIAGSVVVYRSADTTIAKVSTSGLVTAVANGLTAITVVCSPAFTAVPVSVVTVGSVKFLTVTPDSVLLLGTQTVQLVATARDSLGNAVPSAPIVYVSRDPAVVTVSNTGLVSRAGTGTAYVVAAAGPAQDSAQVTGLVARVSVSGTPFATAIYSATRGLVTVKEGSAYRLDLGTPGNIWTVVTGQLPTSITLNSSNSLAYVGRQDGTSKVVVVGTASGVVTDSLTVRGNVLNVLVPPGDSLLVVGTDNGFAYLVRLSTKAVIDSFVANVTNSLVMRGDTTVFANDLVNGAIVEYNLRTRVRVRAIQVGGFPQGMVVAPGGATLYYADEAASRLQILDLASGTISGYVDLPPAGGFGLARNPANGLLYVSTSYYGARVLVVDPVARQVVKTIVTGGVPRRISFTANGSVGIVANEGGWVDYIQ